MRLNRVVQWLLLVLIAANLTVLAVLFGVGGLAFGITLVLLSSLHLISYFWEW